MDASTSQGPFVVRGVAERDLDGLMRLAELLDTVNLPPDRAVLAEHTARSSGAFSGRVPPLERQYLLVVEDLGAGRIVGASMILAQHGTRAAPHVFFDVVKVEHYHRADDSHFIHRVLKIGYTYEGPTEIGGLIVAPEYRAHPLRTGRAIAFTRFLYMALHPADFREQVLAELLPPLGPGGESALWEALGRKFTGLTYREADRRSRHDKDFIRDLFPQDVVYATVLPEAAQSIIGVVGPQSRGIQKLLVETGFAYQNRIDPFDGGPHFAATTTAIGAVRATRRTRLGAVPLAPGDAGDGLALVAVEEPGAAHPFRAVVAHGRTRGDEVAIGEVDRAALGAASGDEIAVIPLGAKR